MMFFHVSRSTTVRGDATSSKRQKNINDEPLSAAVSFLSKSPIAVDQRTSKLPKSADNLMKTDTIIEHATNALSKFFEISHHGKEMLPLCHYCVVALFKRPLPHQATAKPIRTLTQVGLRSDHVEIISSTSLPGAQSIYTGTSTFIHWRLLL